MSSPPFKLLRATSEDIPELTRLTYACFPTEIRELFMGCRSEADLPLITAKYARTLETDPHDVWLKVVDTATGKIAAGSNWKVFPNSGAPQVSDESVGDWVEGQLKQDTVEMMRLLNDARREANPGPHLCESEIVPNASAHPRGLLSANAVAFADLHICFTDANYRRKGLGALMMKWGCDLADLLSLPAWIEASTEGNFLYKKFGFYDFAPMASGRGGFSMKRDVKKEA
ncbi:acyl-CoA N-acyltransferase [Hypoxylon sp. NC1633]|nr:acyl-CoA N-acyltransferase [Hypoxylon sp. NC1633]